jgi:hypothetical protein
LKILLYFQVNAIFYFKKEKKKKTEEREERLKKREIQTDLQPTAEMVPHFGRLSTFSTRTLHQYENDMIN